MRGISAVLIISFSHVIDNKGKEREKNPSFGTN
jgi:hypothetical protein